jgi:transcriptional regulator with XRE-family HTH domain
MSSDEPNGAELAAALDFLRRLIAARRMSLGDLDDKLGHARGYVSRLLQGNTRLTYDQILSILKGIDVEPAFFFSTLHPLRKPLPAAASGRLELAELRALIQQLRRSLPEIGDTPPPTGDDLESRILAAVQEVLAEDLPRSLKS